jgi:hypothetical protein
MDVAAGMNASRDAAPPLIAEQPSEPPVELKTPTAAQPPEPPPAQAEPVTAQAEPVPASQTAERPKASYSAHATKGQSVASFFQVLLAARPPGSATPTSAPGPSTSAPAGATPPTEDGLSPVPAGSQLKDAAVSFDDFFSSAGGGASSLPPGGGDPKNDDLDSFQSWLQNLKR